MKIQVTQKHIDAGERCAVSYCPVSLAAKEAGLIDVDVYGSKIAFRFKEGEDKHMERLPQKASYFIDRFDKGKRVKPFCFFVDENRRETQ